jgi:preprotein translocase subunit SecG
LVSIFRRKIVEGYLELALIITSVALIISIVLQSKGVGLGGLTGADTGTVFTARRGVEKTLFWITIGLSVLFIVLTLVVIVVRG